MSDFSDADVERVWSKGKTIEGLSPAKYRLDVAGALMVRDEYGQETDYAWEIDHIFPKKKLEALGVSEGLWNGVINLQPMHAKNNASKGDDYPSFSSSVRFDAVKGVNKHVDGCWSFTGSLQKKLSSYFGLIQ